MELTYNENTLDTCIENRGLTIIIVIQSYLEEFIFLNHTVMKYNSNLPWEEVGHEENDNREDNDSYSSEESEVPGPTKVRVKSYTFSMVISKWKYHRGIIYDDNTVTKAGKNHD